MNDSIDWGRLLLAGSRAKRAARQTGWVQRLAIWRHRQRFFSEPGLHLCHGSYGSFAEARAALPASPEFDDDQLANEYLGPRTDHVFAYDYPVMHWLGKAFAAGAASVVDIGGSIGVHCLAYRRYLSYPQSLRWQVLEVPAVVRLGQALALREGVTALVFDGMEALATADADVWLSAGALQYIEGGRPDELLQRASHRPRWLVLNKLPLYDGEDFVSTQCLGPGHFAPMQVYGRARLLAAVAALGYTLVDGWQVPERSFNLPGQPEKSFGWFSGLVFRRDGCRRPE